MTATQKIQRAFDAMLPNEKSATTKFIAQVKNPQNYDVTKLRVRAKLLQMYEDWLLAGGNQR